MPSVYFFSGKFTQLKKNIKFSDELKHDELKNGELINDSPKISSF